MTDNNNTTSEEQDIVIHTKGHLQVGNRIIDAKKISYEIISTISTPE